MKWEVSWPEFPENWRGTLFGVKMEFGPAPGPSGSGAPFLRFRSGRWIFHSPQHPSRRIRGSLLESVKERQHSDRHPFSFYREFLSYTPGRRQAPGVGNGPRHRPAPNRGFGPGCVGRGAREETDMRSSRHERDLAWFKAGLAPNRAMSTHQMVPKSTVSRRRAGLGQPGAGWYMGMA